MTYAETVERIAASEDLPKATVDKVLKHFASLVETQCKLDRNVQLPGFGRFSKKTTKARKMAVPNFGGTTESPLKTVDVPAKSTIKFKAFGTI
jgi:nucleoid DNA-binding protein